jgi:hypothetical protein
MCPLDLALERAYGRTMITDRCRHDEPTASVDDEMRGG